MTSTNIVDVWYDNLLAKIQFNGKKVCFREKHKNLTNLESCASNATC